uniref:G_PROTEIN_RECEP_F1_2 domain-containing protein n=1 Tax=Brugia pahangi TaxID=6280 RepID=A0A0N4TKJ1_BRUPA
MDYNFTMMMSTVHFCPHALSKRTIKRYRRRIPSSHHSGGNAKRVNGLLVLAGNVLLLPYIMPRYNMGYRPLCAINTDYYPEHLPD